MSKSYVAGILILITSLTTVAASQKFKVPRLQTAGRSFKHPVVAQTAPEFVEKKAGITIVRRFYISRWGVHRYEYGMVQYQCKTSQCEMLGEPVALKFYNECKGLKKNGKPNCTELQSARIDVTDPYADNHESRDIRHWYTCEDYGSPCADRDELNEYPSRYTPENSDLPSGL